MFTLGPTVEIGEETVTTACDMSITSTTALWLTAYKSALEIYVSSHRHHSINLLAINATTPLLLFKKCTPSVPPNDLPRLNSLSGSNYPSSEAHGFLPVSNPNHLRSILPDSIQTLPTPSARCILAGQANASIP